MTTATAPTSPAPSPRRSTASASAGFAPDVTLVNMRAGQDSGFFFLDATIDALTYAGDNGIDVVNMSFYTDPWLFNCTNNPADSPAEQRRAADHHQGHPAALDYAHDKGVDAGRGAGQRVRPTSVPDHRRLQPGLPDPGPGPHQPGDQHPAAAHHRQHVPRPAGRGSPRDRHLGDRPEHPPVVLLQLRHRADGRLGPGGDSRDTGTGLANPANRVLSTTSLQGLVARGFATPDGTLLSNRALKECVNGDCGYYVYDQGTSMASPHTVGVVALIISQYGERGRGGRIVMEPDEVQRILFRTATKTACPAVNPFVYPDTPGYTPFCEGTTAKNGFYGNGIVNAAAAVSRRR